jgi:SAM-dependent methyltransferase
MGSNRYQDYVIKDGSLIADWDNLYTDFNDPWRQSENDQRNSASRVMTRFYIDRLRDEFNTQTVLELGCGLAWLTEDLHSSGIKVRGTDVSKVCIARATERNPSLDLKVANFLDKAHMIDYDPDVIVMSQLTWYVLEDLTEFIKSLKLLPSSGKPKFLVHSLATYAQGTQLYGKEFFTTGEEIKSFFNLNYLFSMSTETQIGSSLSFDAMFVAKL